MNALFAFDREYDCSLLAGVDEAGRGPLAGPVYAAAVCLDPSQAELLSDVRDSKQLAPAKRKALSLLIREKAQGFSVAWAEPKEIDEINIHHASLLAMYRALSNLTAGWEFALVDGKFVIPGIDVSRQQAVVKGDAQSACVAAASILAKVARDERMVEYHGQYPQYEFWKHKGYPTGLHIQRLRQFGPCPIHRRTFCEKFLPGKNIF